MYGCLGPETSCQDLPDSRPGTTFPYLLEVIVRTQTADMKVIRKALRELVWKFLSFYAGIFLINFRLGSAANTERAERRALYLVGLPRCKGTYMIYGSWLVLSFQYYQRNKTTIFSLYLSDNQISDRYCPLNHNHKMCGILLFSNMSSRHVWIGLSPWLA